MGFNDVDDWHDARCPRRIPTEDYKMSKCYAVVTVRDSDDKPIAFSRYSELEVAEAVASGSVQRGCTNYVFHLEGMYGGMDE